VAILLAGAFGRLDTPSLLWVSAPIVVLGLAEAGYAAMERTYLEQTKRGTTAELPGSQQLPPPVGLGGFLSALGTFSVWPFYLLLWGIFVAGAINLPRHLPKDQVTTVVPAPPKIPSATNVPSGMNHFPAMPQRPQNGPANLPATYPAYPTIPLHTPATGYPRPATPVNFGPRPLVRPPITPPSPVPTPGSAPAATSPSAR
jgi:hypothetical protein